KYSIIISENIALLDEREILLLAIDNVFKDIKVVKQRLVDIINNEHQSRKEQPGLYKYPDHLQEALNSYIILYLLEKIDDLSMLVPYKEYSSCLEFLLNPDEFDYSSIDIDDYMWLNILKQKEYRDIIIQHRDQLVIEELKLAVERNCANEEQKKIVYRYILSEDEIFS
ncbi:MAG: hypothetical protein J6F30_05775, partial [Cellulosilyticum sp.]|nr:hypothetical protein [Cellulosilyticum sp.]